MKKLIAMFVCVGLTFAAFNDRLTITNDNGTIQYFNIDNDGAITTAGAQTITGDIGVTGGVTTSGDVDVNGSLLLDVTYVSYNSTLTTTQSGMVISTATSSAFSIGLPTAVGNTGVSYTIKEGSVTATTGSAYTLTVNPLGDEEIDDSATNTQMNATNDYITIISDGDEWLIVAEKEN